MTKNKKQILGHVLACGTQIMWGATFVSTKVLLKYFLPVEILFTRAVFHMFWNLCQQMFKIFIWFQIICFGCFCNAVDDR